MARDFAVCPARHAATDPFRDRRCGVGLPVPAKAGGGNRRAWKHTKTGGMSSSRSFWSAWIAASRSSPFQKLSSIVRSKRAHGGFRACQTAAGEDVGPPGKMDVNLCAKLDSAPGMSSLFAHLDGWASRFASAIPVSGLASHVFVRQIRRQAWGLGPYWDLCSSRHGRRLMV